MGTMDTMDTMVYDDEGFTLAFLQPGESVRRAKPGTPEGAVEVLTRTGVVYAEPGDTLVRYHTGVVRAVPPGELAQAVQAMPAREALQAVLRAARAHIARESAGWVENGGEQTAEEREVLALIDQALETPVPADGEPDLVWTDEVVENLRRRQAAEDLHPYTCSCGDHVALEPRTAGWWCPVEQRIVQRWAHLSDLAFPADYVSFLDQLRGLRAAGGEAQEPDGWMRKAAHGPVYGPTAASVASPREEERFRRPVPLYRRPTKPNSPAGLRFCVQKEADIYQVTASRGEVVYEHSKQGAAVTMMRSLNRLLDTYSGRREGLEAGRCAHCGEGVRWNAEGDLEHWCPEGFQAVAAAAPQADAAWAVGEPPAEEWVVGWVVDAARPDGEEEFWTPVWRCGDELRWRFDRQAWPAHWRLVAWRRVERPVVTAEGAS